ncbi:MAG: TraB/GumN family protein [Saprospiraceae bacterium]|nr:TraB/GumN family protein [Saprospiraceae bacterium]
MLKIKNLLLITFISFIGSYSLTAQQAESTATSIPSVSADKKALLWEITGKDLSKPSYLYGTIHMIPKKDFFLSDAAKKAIDSCKRVTFEINMKDMNNPMALVGVFMKAMMNDGSRLKDLVSKEDYKLVKNHFDSLGLPMAMLERVKPMFLSVMVDGGGAQMNPFDTTATESANVSYEFEIMRIAEKQKKEFAGLETMEFQMSIFDSIPYKAQAEMLVKSVKSGGKGGDNEFAKMVEMYKEQDIEAMAKMLNPSDSSDTEGLGQYETMLVTTRNLNWIPLMGKSMAKRSTFFAVGAGHLGGEKGVVNLLRKEGYTLRPLK